jgi:hypothetical protein
MARYQYQTLRAFLEASNEGSFIRREDVAPNVLQKSVWLGMVSPEGGYLPFAHYASQSRADAAAWLREHGARGLGRSGPASDYRRGLVFELVPVSVNELF